jgi:Tfp pilus assembly protein PilV
MEPDGAEPVDVPTPPVARARRRLLAPLDSVRVRITIAATLAFGFAFAGASVALVHTVRSSLEARQHAEATRAGQRLVAQLQAGTDPDQLSTNASEPVYFQVSAGGRVVATSGDANLPILTTTQTHV